MGELTCVTLNIWNRFGPWDERLPRLQDGLRALDPDIVGLQEVLVLEDGSFDQSALVARGGPLRHVAWGKCSKNAHPVGNAILSRFPIKDSASFDLDDGGTNEHRVLVYALLDTPHGEVPVFVTHLNWKLDEGHIRVLQVKEVAAIVAIKAPKTGFPPILMGDFNAEPDSDEMRYLRGLTGLGERCVYFADCFAATRGAPGSSQDPHGYTFARDNQFALLCREPNRRIDYVFVGGPDDRGRGEPLASSLCMNQATDGMHPSDHYGVWAKISA
jgi:endonuclease/exonuclease/phosphatase family metal-dependent hydrolase